MKLALDAFGLESYKNALKNIEQIPDDVLLEMVDSKAEIVEQTTVFTASTDLQGPYYEGGVMQSVKRSKPRKNKRTGPYSMIRFVGTQHGNRLGEIAFVNEYGKKNQPARPFIRRAIEGSEDTSTAAAANVLFGWQKKQGL